MNENIVPRDSYAKVKHNKTNLVETRKKNTQKDLYLDFFNSYDKSFFERIIATSKIKGFSCTSLCDYLSKKYELKFNEVVEMEKFSEAFLYYIKNSLDLVVMNGSSSYYNSEVKKKYNIPNEDKVIIDQKLFRTIANN